MPGSQNTLARVVWSNLIRMNTDSITASTRSPRRALPVGVERAQATRGQMVLKDDARSIAFANPLRFDTVVANWSLFPTFNTPTSTC